MEEGDDDGEGFGGDEGATDADEADSEGLEDEYVPPRPPKPAGQSDVAAECESPDPNTTNHPLLCLAVTVRVYLSARRLAGKSMERFWLTRRESECP
jgi:hypothetical protein